MVDAQTIGVLVTAASVSVAAIYYILTLRITQRNIKHTLETRQAQFFMQFYQSGFGSIDGLKAWLNVMHYEFKDYDEFEEKYGSVSNPQACAERLNCWKFYDALGIYMKQGLVDKEFVYDYISTYPIWLWMKFGDTIKRHWEIYKDYDNGTGLEYLYLEMMKMKKERGEPMPPLTFDTYVKQ